MRSSCIFGQFRGSVGKQVQTVSFRERGLTQALELLLVGADLGRVSKDRVGSDGVNRDYGRVILVLVAVDRERATRHREAVNAGIDGQHAEAYFRVAVHRRGRWYSCFLTTPGGAHR